MWKAPALAVSSDRRTSFPGCAGLSTQEREKIAESSASFPEASSSTDVEDEGLIARHESVSIPARIGASVLMNDASCKSIGWRNDDNGFVNTS